MSGGAAQGGRGAALALDGVCESPSAEDQRVDWRHLAVFQGADYSPSQPAAADGIPRLLRWRRTYPLRLRLEPARAA